MADATREDYLQDGDLHVLLAGTGSPEPGSTRAGACVAVLVAGRTFVFDSGPGSPARMLAAGVPLTSVSDVFLTHYHSDHLNGLPELSVQRWVTGRATSPLVVHGPIGSRHAVGEVVAGFNQSMLADREMRTANQPDRLADPEAGLLRARPFGVQGPDAVRVYEGDGVIVDAFLVDHGPVRPAVGYRLSYAGRSVVVSGDTAKSANLARHSRKADLLVHEAMDKQSVRDGVAALRDLGVHERADQFESTLEYHSSFADATEVAAEADVAELVYTHIIPDPPNMVARNLFLQRSRGIFDGDRSIAEDGDWWHLTPQA
ncbi:MBL fold metallo-hydrolase [Micromonospora sp. CPCC 205371]|nr:MBL fold metallo-hydrolase [Micromonospora sp. CPCC 205371]